MSRGTASSIEQHPERAEIEAMMVTSSNRAVAERFGLSKDAVRRHRDKLSPALKAVAERRQLAGAESATDRAEGLYRRAEGVLNAAEQDGNGSLSLAAIKELRSTVELLAKLSGELDTKPTVTIVNVAQSPEWAELRARLVGALERHPEAMADVLAALGDGVIEAEVVL